MSIDASEQQGEKVREDLNSYSHPGADCFRRRAVAAWRGVIILKILRILAILIQTTKTRAGPIKVLSDLRILFLLRVYRHSGPLGPGVHPVHPGHPANPASDTEKARRGTGPRPTVARAARLLNRSARACPSHALTSGVSNVIFHRGHQKQNTEWLTTEKTSP